MRRYKYKIFITIFGNIIKQITTIFILYLFLISYYPLRVSSVNNNNNNNKQDEIIKIEINDVNNNDTIIGSGNGDLNFNLTKNNVITINNNENSDNDDDKVQVHYDFKKFIEPTASLLSLDTNIIKTTTTSIINDKNFVTGITINERVLNESENNNNDNDNEESKNNNNSNEGNISSRKNLNNNDQNHKLNGNSNTITKAVLIYTPSSLSKQTFIPPVTFNKTFTSIGRITTPEEYAKSVIFRYYINGQLTYIADGINTESLDETGCNANDKFAFILHGWRQNCDVEWVPLLITKLTQYRGGCIICIDYGYFAQEPYVRLVRQYEPLSDLITEKLRHLRNQGFNPDKGYMFGFSYGGQLACAVGRKLGPKLIKEIDTCDMAGPGFDYKVNRLDHRDAAQNVQCIHTTRDKGTKYYTCHQDWRMGNCGFSQPAAKDPPKGSHGLCPYFYINAFEYAFYAVKQPDKCISRRPANYWPDGFKMGYMESRKNLVNGELFAYTGAQYPFNVAITTNNDTIMNSNINSNINNNNNHNTIINALPYHSPFIQQAQTQLLFYGTPSQIPNFRDRPVLNSIMRARKFLKRLQRNLRKRYSI